MTYVADNKTASDFTRRLDEAVEAIKNGEGWRIEYMQLKEKFDMNYNAGLEMGRKEGLKEDIEKGKKDGIKEGLEKGEIEGIEVKKGIWLFLC